MKTILVIWHSHTGGTAQMVAALVEGARGVDGVRVIERHAVDATAEALPFAGHSFDLAERPGGHAPRGRPLHPGGRPRDGDSPHRTVHPNDALTVA